MDSLFIILVVVSFLVFLLVIYKLNYKLKDLKNSSAVELLKSDVIELSRAMNELTKSVGGKLDINHESMQQQLTQSSKLITDVTERLTKLDETNKRVVDVADELKTLQNVLQNPKQRGVFGEYYLESVLGNILPSKNFQMQYKFQDGEIVDAVIFLDKGKMLPIDSKFSLENYNRMVGEDKKVDRQKLLAKVKADLKTRIDETSKYIRPDEKTMDFAFMFIPSESLYYDLLIGDVGTGSSARDLIEYAFRDKKVIIVSPTSFMAYLQTVLQGLRSLQIEEQAKEIQLRVGRLGQHLNKFEDYMKRLGKSLAQTVGHYNGAYKELGKVDKDVVKVAGGEASIDPLLLDKPSEDE